MKTTNRKSSEFTRAKQAFEASNLKAVWRGGIYIVYSYGWFPLFIYNQVQDCWLMNSEKYSVSTSKQMTQCHPGCKTELRTLEELKDIIACQRYQRDGQVA